MISVAHSSLPIKRKQYHRAGVKPELDDTLKCTVNYSLQSVLTYIISLMLRCRKSLFCITDDKRFPVSFWWRALWTVAGTWSTHRQWFSNFRVPENHLKSLSNCFLGSFRFWQYAGVPEFAFLTSLRVILMLLVEGPYFDSHLRYKYNCSL